MAKSNRTVQLHWALLIIGLILISVAIAIEFNRSTDKILILLTTIGGTILGSSISWIIEYKFKRDDNLPTSEELWEQSLHVIQSIKRDKDLPREEQLQIFRKNLIHFYHISSSENEKLYWHYTTFNFEAKKQKHVGRLVSETSFFNINKSKSFTYIVEIIRRYSNDYLIIKLRNKNGQEPISIAIIDACPGIKTSYGFMLLEDWKENYRLSPAIIAFEPLYGTSVGPMSREDSLDIQRAWNKNFKNDTSYRKIFEEYI